MATPRNLQLGPWRVVPSALGERGGEGLLRSSGTLEEGPVLGVGGARKAELPQQSREGSNSSVWVLSIEGRVSSSFCCCHKMS